MIIKVCGMRESENILQLAELEVDYMGFIFYPHSKRFAGSLDRDILASLPASIKKTGVFVNEDMDVIVDKVINYRLDAVQLHGDESPEFCGVLQDLLHNERAEKRIELIKAFGIYPGFNFDELRSYMDVTDYFIFDTKTTEYGGSGITFDWNILKDYKAGKPYFLSGGLSADNIDSINNLSDPNLYGLDLNSRFETEPGIKDIKKLQSVFQLIRV